MPEALAHPREKVGVEREALVRAQPKELLGRPDLVRAERRSVRLRRVARMRRGPRDRGPQLDEGGSVDFGLRGHQRGMERGHVHGSVGVLPDPMGGPPVRLVPQADVLVERERGVALDGDVVVVIDDAQRSEVLHSRQGGGLRGDALLEVPVTGDRPDAVVEGAGSSRGVRIEEPPLVAGGHRHPDRHGQTLSEGPGGGLDARRVPVLRVAGGSAAPGAEGLEIGQRQSVVGEEELAVERQAGVAAGEDESVAAEPGRVLGVVAHDLLEEQVGGRCQAHRRARMPVPDPLDGVRRQRPQVGDGAVVVVRPVERTAVHGTRGQLSHDPTLASGEVPRRAPAGSVGTVF